MKPLYRLKGRQLVIDSDHLLRVLTKYPSLCFIHEVAISNPTVRHVGEIVINKNLWEDINDFSHQE